MARMRKHPQILLAEALKAAKSVARDDDVVSASDLDRRYREILVKGNYLREIIKGWYLLTTLEGEGESTAWFGGFWAFLKLYLTKRFGADGFCLSAESSLNVHAGDTIVPRQLIVLTQKASNTKISLPHDTSVLLLMDRKNFPNDTEEWKGVRIMSLASALCRLSPAYFKTNPHNMEIVLKSAALQVAEVSRAILKTMAIASAERIIGAYRHFGETAKANQLTEDLLAAGYSLKEVDPFIKYEPRLGSPRDKSPYAGRIRMMWNSMRDAVEHIMPDAPGINRKAARRTIMAIQETYRDDAYHSLSIEGYRVTKELIARIASGEWDPENVEADRTQRDAMAAKGYQEAFQAVVQSVTRMLDGDSPGQVFEDDLQSWYRKLFAPSLRANLLSGENLAGYRNQPVYIKKSRHVPPPHSAVPDCMEVLFDLLKTEENAAVRAVLGHFIFVFVHPYMDGNGRVGRFLMNLLLVSGGFNWTVIRTEKRNSYLDALEQASVGGNIKPFAKFIKEQLDGV